MKKERPMKVCFVSPGIYPYLNTKSRIERVGGAELQQLFISTGLQRRGFAVSFVTTDHGQPDREIIKGMTVYKTYHEDKGIPGIRFFYPRIVRTWRALGRADADIYYCRAAGYLPGILALFCRIHRKKFVFASASDTDFLPGQELVRLARDRFLFRLGIRRASAVFVQSNYQNELLWNNYRLKGTVIRNFFDGEVLKIPSHELHDILWVSTIRQLKRPILFVELAKCFPGEQFVMIGGPDGSNPALFDEVKKRCAGLPNIKFLGFQPHEITDTYFDRCKIFINTSEHEGFPNTFLQAWRRGIPVITYVDPDDIIREHGLGFAVQNAQQMKDALVTLLKDADDYRAHITEYYTKHHSSHVIENYGSLLKGLVNVV